MHGHIIPIMHRFREFTMHFNKDCSECDRSKFFSFDLISSYIRMLLCHVRYNEL